MSGRPVAVFASWSGRYSDNPRAIGEELHRRGDPVEQHWLLEPETAAVPDHVQRVAPDGPETIALLERADFIVSNDVLAHPFAKAGHARYGQTWHGTPLKRIAHDVRKPTFPERENYTVWLPRDVGRWDVVLAPNDYSAAIFGRAFRFEGEIRPVGAPRNDALFAPDRDAVRARVREELEIPDGARAVLYAPTWRDHYAFEPALDLEALGRALGPEHVILVRAHWLVRDGLDVTGPGVRAVSGHGDIRELYLAADALVTDYSSVMFDFANTGKPMVFYVYDLAHYRDELRGFYFDLAAEAPGPLVTRTDAVAAALLDLEGVAKRHAEAYAAFRARYCHLDDGHASVRAADAIFGPA